jgi:hypothetical protein
MVFGFHDLQSVDAADIFLGHVRADIKNTKGGHLLTKAESLAGQGCQQFRILSAIFQPHKP